MPQDSLGLAGKFNRRSYLLILPLLPDRALGPFGVLNRALLWKLVVLVLVIGALGHIALRVVGDRWGLSIAGFFAGYVSSTAAIAGFGQRVRATPELLAPAFGAAMLANLASLSLFIPILLAVSPALLRAAAPELIAAALAYVGGGLFGLRRRDAPIHPGRSGEKPRGQFGQNHGRPPADAESRSKGADVDDREPEAGDLGIPRWGAGARTQWVGQNSDCRPPAIFGGVPIAGPPSIGECGGSPPTSGIGRWPSSQPG